MLPRLATLIDVPAIVAMGARFHAMSPHRPVGEYDAAAVARVVRMLITSPDGVVVTNEEGMIGGLIAPVYFSPDVRMLEEHFWWSGKGGRDLLRAFEDEGRRRGAHLVMLSTLENDRSAAIDRLVSRQGYGALEKRYMKRISE